MFRFGNVEALWLLLLVPVLGVVLWVARHRRLGRIRTLGEEGAVARMMPYASRGRYWIRYTLYLLSLGFLVLALARPQFGVAKVNTKSTGSEIMVVLDISRSMQSGDVKPSRLERAKLEIAQLVNHLKRDRIGLILFAGRSYVQLPITSDYTAALMFLQSVNPDMIEQQGTVLGDALQLAMRSFGPKEDIGKSIIVISDGESHEGDPLAVAKEAAEQGIHIFTVGIGSSEGAPIPDGKGGMLTDGEGKVVISRLDEKTLSEVAAITGGMYMRASGFQTSLDPILLQIDKMQKGEFEKVTYARYNEQFQILLLISLLLLVVSTVMLERKNSWVRMDKLVGTRWRA